METFLQSPGGSRGLWNNPRPSQSSKEAQDMLRLRKEESMLTNIQRKQIHRYPKASLQASDPSTSSSLSQPVPIRQPQRSQRRSVESCRSGGNYEREKFHPGPTRDLEKEKRRLQSILATGKEESTAELPQKTAICKQEASEEIDHYQQVLEEIEERRQFLADMAALGQDSQYVHIINNQISQRIQELELLDKASHSNKEPERSGQEKTSQKRKKKK